ncbi:hypothetical protein E4U21_002560 [Claviceps maximensis]|nr:hypothetical protein E4U21_002560 [Claviceps maximensis]
MSRKFYIETSPTGKSQFVSIKRSRSQGNHHDHPHQHCHKKHHVSHHHHHPSQETYFEAQEYYRVRVEDWNRIKERERCLEEKNTRLVADVSALKASLATAQAEADKLNQVVVPQLQTQITVLTADNEALRKSLENAGNNEGKHCREEEKLNHTIEKLDKEKKELKDENGSLKDRLKQAMEKLGKEKKELRDENTGLKDKLKDLQRQMEQGVCGSRCSRSRSHSRSRSSDLLLDEIEHWRNLYRHWKDRHDDTKRLHDDVCATLEIRTEKMRAYEEILKRRRII